VKRECKGGERLLYCYFCFFVPTETLSYDSCVTITIHHYTVWTPVVLAITNVI